MKLLPFLLMLFSTLLMLSAGFSDSVSSNAHIKLTDGITASNNPNDSAWIAFNKDSTQLPAALPTAPNTDITSGFFGTGEFRNTSNLSVETNMESMLRQAGSESYRHNIYWQLFAEPSLTSPYWNWSWFESHTDGQRIRRAINAGQLMNLVLNKVPRWANKSLAIEHPPMLTVIEEQVTLNSTSTSQLSHRLIMGEKNEAYDKAQVVLVNHATATVSNETVGTGNNTSFQEFNLQHTAIVPGSQRIYVNGALWQEVEFFRGSSTLDKQAYVFFPNTGKLRFGDSWNGPKLPSGATVTASYSYYTNPYREYSGSSYNTTDQLDYRIDYVNGTIRRTSNSTIPSGSTVKVTYYYLDTTWWQRFWTEAVNHYEPDVIYFEVWNEENLSQSWPGTIDQYAELLKTAYTSIKAANPNAQVVLGGLGFDTDYLSNLYSRGIKNYFDVLAWHPYGWQVGPDDPASHYNVLNNRLFSVAAANGDSAKPVFFNEIGYSTNQQGGMSWDNQGIALSRTLMMVRRNPLIQNVSWWGPVDSATIGQQESDLYYYHLGLMAYNSSGVLQQKPAYYTFKNIAATKGIIIDLAAYNSSGAITQEKYDVNKIQFSSFGDDIYSVLVSYSQKNANDWQTISASTLSVAASDKNTFIYAASFPTVNTRFIQIQFTKKANASDYALDEVKVITTSGANAAQGKYYSVEGFTANFSGSTTNLCGNNTPDSGETCQNCPSDVACPQIPTCSAGQIICNSQCTTPVCSTDTTCNDNNSLTTDTCINPNTCIASCQNTYIPPQTPTCTIGQILCSNSCIYPTCINDSACNDNNSQTTDTCLNSNSCNASCQYTFNSLTTPTCLGSQILCNNQCITASCSANTDCNDNNSLTTDTCSNAGTCAAVCQFTQNASTGGSTGGTGGGGTGGGGSGGGGVSPSIKCTNNKQCNDNNPCTKDVCQNPGLSTATCAYTKVNKCRGLFVNIFNVNLTSGITKGTEFTAIITNESGEAVSDANATYNNISRLTNANGEVNFTAGNTDSILRVEKDGFDTSEITVIVAAEQSQAQDSQLTITAPQKVEPNSEFVVTVRDKNGNTVKGATVTYGNQTKITDENGKATLIADSNANYLYAVYGNAQSQSLLVVNEHSLVDILENIDILYVGAVIFFLLLVAVPLFSRMPPEGETESQDTAQQ